MVNITNEWPNNNTSYQISSNLRMESNACVKTAIDLVEGVKYLFVNNV